MTLYPSGQDSVTVGHGAGLASPSAAPFWVLTVGSGAKTRGFKRVKNLVSCCNLTGYQNSNLGVRA